MNSHKGEPAKITGEIPVYLNLLAVVNKLSTSYLKLKGLFYLFTGFTWLFLQSPYREAGIAWLEFLTPEMVGSLWTLAGLVSIFAGFYGGPNVKRWGFVALIAVPTLIGLYFLISWLIYIIPGIHAPGYERGIVTTVSCGAFAISAYLVARVYTFSQGGLEQTDKERR